MEENIDQPTSEKKKRIFPVNADSKPAIIVFFFALMLIVGLTFSLRGIYLIETYAITVCLFLLVTAAYPIVAVAAMKLTAQTRHLLPTKNRMWLQILIGLVIAIALCLVFGVIPILCGDTYPHTEPTAENLILGAVQNILFVGVGEEIVCRGYIQNQFQIWLKKCKWLAPLIAAVIFGLWHIINGDLEKVLFATVVGCVFGYSKYLFKDCTLLSVIIAHGFYDLFLVLLSCFMV